MRKLLKYLSAKDRILVLISAIFVLLQVWLDLNLPAYMAKITMLIQNPSAELFQIIKSGLVMLGFAAGSLVSACIVTVCAAGISSSFGGALRRGLFSKIMSFSMEETQRAGFSTASLITRTTNDVKQIQSFVVMGLQVLIKAPITAIGALIKINGTVWQWTAATLIGVFVMAVIVVACIMISLPKQKLVQALTDQINRLTREQLTGIEPIHAYNAEKYIEEKFGKANDEITRTTAFTQKSSAFLSPAVQLVLNALSLSIYWMGSLIIFQADAADKAVLFANMLAFVQYATQIVSAIVMMTLVFSMIPRAMISANRIGEVLETKLSIVSGGYSGDGSGDVAGKAGTTGKVVTTQKGTVEFKNVSFRYPGDKKNVLSDLSFTAKKGETVAIIGSIGSGKTSLLNLIPRFYDATDGTVFVDGKNVKDYELSTLRRKIGFVPQKAFLFSGTISENLSYGCGGKKSEEAIAEAARTAQAESFIAEKDGGFDTQVSQGGTNFSGGQKQRLSIARALAKKPEILILDDSFSALDYKTDKILRAELKKNYADTTKIIVAQRISTVRDADKIIVLDKGKIAGTGTHETLLADCEVYRQIALSQGESVKKEA